ncbi:glucose repression regulatory protein Tup1 [Mitosporidium daphniae]|uniref:Glucose repression regulatory protein Tup1 n=1 Tax=Mitosporidium daphniae TaxID=1485682 RepID=A0A098VSS8_9MICR|nr:glucose repression regulatory protein Tup1 [Mitosporidium daphniae]KGG52052.1 glucose repression regulatory protein Tup1 [Mitosporidium daphniae]|eukprot:XP_013238479.1 glucose repression regulatory protein Tup1 [Mitosporidium daphniae]
MPTQSMFTYHAYGLESFALEYIECPAPAQNLPDWGLWVWPEDNPSKIPRITPALTFDQQHKDLISSVRWANSGKYFAFGSFGIVQLFEAESMSLLKEFSCGLEASTPSTVGSFIRTIDFHPSGSFLAAGSENKVIYILQFDSNVPLQVITHHPQDIYCIKYSPSGEQLASVSGDSHVAIWDVHVEERKHILLKEISILRESDSEYSKDCIISFVCWSKDGKFIFVTSLGSSLYVINVELGTVSIHSSGHSASIYHLSLSSDGKKLASASLDKTIRIWLISCDENDQLILSSCLSILEGHQDYVLSVTFSSDSRYIISSSKDTSIIIWCAFSYTLLCKIASYKNSVLCIDSHPKLPLLLVGSGDCRMSIWNYK